MAPLANVASQGVVCLDCKRASYNVAWGNMRWVINPMIDDTADEFRVRNDGSLYGPTPPRDDDEEIVERNGKFEQAITLIIEIFDLNRLTLVQKRRSKYKAFSQAFDRRSITEHLIIEAYELASKSEFSCAALSAIRDTVGEDFFIDA